MLIDRCLATAGLIAVALVASAVPANAEVQCPPGTIWTGGHCQPNPEDPENPPQTGCHQSDPAISNIPCRVNGYTFSAELDRYLRPLPLIEGEKHRPPSGEFSHLGVWTGPPDEGWIYDWQKLAAVWNDGNIAWGARGLIWLPAPPGVPTVDPEDLAEQILLDMDLEPVTIGIAPRPGAGSAGLVGLPNWTWAEKPSPNTWGPLVVSDSAGGITVTVTSEVDHVTWDMGDGSSHTCTTPGTPFKDSDGIKHSPDCGGQHAYEAVGDYTVTATSTWSAAWEASTGASGTLDVDPASSNVDIAIRELQVIGQ